MVCIEDKNLYVRITQCQHLVFPLLLLNLCDGGFLTMKIPSELTKLEQRKRNNYPARPQKLWKQIPSEF